MNARDAAMAVLHEEAEECLVEAVEEIYQAGKGRWEYDPDFPGVVGLIKSYTANRALVVVYVEEGDFEVSLELEKELRA